MKSILRNIRKKVAMVTCLVIILLSLVATRSAATTYYVKTVAAGSGNGSSWTNASADLQAIINGSTSGDQIWVAAGTYLPTRDYSGSTSPGDVRTKAFTLKNGVKLYGGFIGTETLLSQQDATANVTILSGDIGTASVATDNSYHVVLAINLTNTSVFDGFTVRDGYANGGSATYGGNTIYHTFGGGLLNAQCTYTISNIIFRNNYGNEGSAVVNTQAEGISPYPTVTINDCKFISNISNNNSGALYTHAGNCNVNRSSFESNTGAGIGGFPYGYYQIDRCAFISNTNTNSGGAAWIRKGSMQIKNSVFASNSANYGGAVFVVDENGESSANIYNCTFYNNSATTLGNAFWGTGTYIVNSIFSNNTGSAYTIEGRNGTTVQYSLISASAVTNTSTSSLVAGSPNFFNTADLDGADNKWGTADDGLVITAGSAAYNAGTNGQVQTPAFDIVGSARTLFTTVDLGAYESTTNLNASADANLSALTTTAGTIAPVFSSGTTAYTASVTSGTTSVTVTPTKNNANATIQVQVNSGGYSTVTSGSPSSSLALNVGSNAIDVKVTAENTTTIKTYTITVTRAAPPVAPTITSFTPISGVVGTSVTITGTDFNTTAANNIVYFGATKATVVGTPTATSITVTVPSGASYAPITLINTSSNYSCKSNLSFNPTFTGGKTTIASGDFDAAVTTALADPAFSYQVVTGDLDGDGKAEVVAAGRNSSSLIVLRNTSTSGTVSFGTRYDFATFYPEQFAVALTDLDGDGKLDAVLNGGNLGGWGFSYMRNTSSGTGNFSFATSAGIASTETGLVVATGDMDGDGRPDVILVSNTRIAVYRNTSSVGSISFSNTPYYTASSIQSNYVSCRPTVADIDGDGKLDIVSANDANMLVLLNTSSGSGNINFGTVNYFTAAYPISKTAVGDFDGDGKLDIATSGPYSSATTVLGIFRNTGSVGTPAFTRTDYTTNDPGDLSIADFNGDGKADLAISNLNIHGAYQPVSIFQNNSSSGTITFGTSINLGVSGAFSPYYSTSSDIDGDGRPDVVTSNGNSIAVFHNNSLVPTWTGATNNSWTTASNWNTNAVPGTTAEVAIPSGTTNALIITAAQSIADMSIAAGATVTANNTINVTGTLNNNGTVAGTGTVILNGSSAQTIMGTGTINNLTLNNSTGATISSGKTSVAGTLTLTSGVLTTGGFLTLKSDASGTGRIAVITGGSISGNLSQERYVATKTARAYSFVASPFIQTIANSWQQNVHITGAGTGGTICPTLTQHSNGFDATGANSASMFVYDGTKAIGSRWTSVTGTSAVSLAPGTGYRMNIRGPRSLGCSLLDGSVTSVTAATLTSTGTLSNANKNMGSFTISLLNNGNATVSNDNYLFTGNPYPSQISFAALLAANNGGSGINNTYATYGPDNLVGNYAFWNGATWTGASSGLSNGTGDIIANGQAFFVQGKVAGAGVTLSWTESMKTATANNGYFRQLSPNRLRIGYMLANGQKADEIMMEFTDKVSSTELNDGDIISMNSGSQNLKSIKGDRELAFNTHNISFTSDTVKLNVVSTANGTFKLGFYDFEELVAGTNTKVYLIDSYTGTTQLMNDNKEYAFTVNTNTPATQGSNRFAVVFSKPAPIAMVQAANIKAYPNPVMEQLTIEMPTVDSYTVQLKDINGRTVLQTKANGTVNMKMGKLPAGSYVLEIINAKGEKTTQKIIKQ